MIFFYSNRVMGNRKVTLRRRFRKHMTRKRMETKGGMGFFKSFFGTPAAQGQAQVATAATAQAPASSTSAQTQATVAQSQATAQSSTPIPNLLDAYNSALASVDQKKIDLQSFQDLAGKIDRLQKRENLFEKVVHMLVLLYQINKHLNQDTSINKVLEFELKDAEVKFNQGEMDKVKEEWDKVKEEGIEELDSISYILVKMIKACIPIPIQPIPKESNPKESERKSWNPFGSLSFFKKSDTSPQSSTFRPSVATTQSASQLADAESAKGAAARAVASIAPVSPVSSSAVSSSAAQPPAAQLPASTSAASAQPPAAQPPATSAVSASAASAQPATSAVSASAARRRASF